jgi:hypothetical protein
MLKQLLIKQWDIWGNISEGTDIDHERFFFLMYPGNNVNEIR